MIVLTNTTDNVQLVLATSATTTQLQCISSWRDITTTTHTAGRTVTTTNNITDVNIVPAPASSTQRAVDYLSIINTDSANATVTIKYDANGTEYRIWKGTLATNEKVEYTDEKGFRVITATSGAVKQTINQGTNSDSSVISTVVLTSDVINNNASPNNMADITGLSFPVIANSTYWFRFVIPYTSAATTTGSRWSISSAFSPNFLNYTSTYTLTNTTQTVNGGLTAFDTPAAANATSLTDGNVAIIEGIIKPYYSSTIIGRFASEVASSAITAKAGAILFYQKIL